MLQTTAARTAPLRWPNSRLESRVCSSSQMARSRHVTNPTSGTDALRRSTCFRVTLVYVADNQNITLSLPRQLLKRVKRLAADRDTSVSALMTEALGRLTDEER